MFGSNDPKTDTCGILGTIYGDEEYQKVQQHNICRLCKYEPINMTTWSPRGADFI